MPARRWAGWLVGLVLALGWSGVALTPAYACSCVADRTDQESYDSAETVFSGIMTTVERADNGFSGAPNRFTFEVSGVFKGSATTTQVVTTAGSGDAVSTDLCSGSRPGPAPTSFGAARTPTPDVGTDRRQGRLVETRVWILAAVLGVGVLAWTTVVVRRSRSRRD